jgi:outer membrane protein
MKFLITGLILFSALLSQAQKFAYVDSKYILSHIPEYQQAQAEVNKLSAQWQKDIENKYETIAKLETSLQAEKILLTDEMKQKREQEIETKRQEAKDMQKAKFGINGELFKKREELVKPRFMRPFKKLLPPARSWLCLTNRRVATCFTPTRNMTSVIKS